MTTFHAENLSTEDDNYQYKDQTKKGYEDSWHEELKSKEKKTIHENAGVLL